MCFRIISILAVAASIIFSSCAPKHSDIIVAKVGSEKITLGEFEKVYAKNAGGIDAAKKDSIDRIKSFLDLYVNFKMKLRDAEVRGYDKNPLLDAELNDYKQKVGISYLLEKEIIEPGLINLYEKRKYELRVSHLMLRPDTSSEETNKKLAIALIDSINNHDKKFEDLVKKYSVDNYSRKDGGDIYYITAGMIIPEFEDAAYKTEVGKIYPEPVKTRYGYHIIKVTEKIPRVPQIRASHILITFKNDSGKVDTAAALAAIKDIKKQLDNGADFAELAKKYSKDPGSKAKGGDLDYFERRMMVQPFDEAAFNLAVGQVSDIVRTNFGYHLIKVTEKKPYPTFEEDKENLKKIYKQTRYDLAYSDFVKKLEKQYNLKTNDNVIDLVSVKADTAKVGEGYLNSNLRASLKDSVIYSINNKGITVDSLMSSISVMPEFINKPINKKLVSDAVNKDAENKALMLQVMNMDGKDSDFTALMDEYKNGIYIFKLQEEEVWDKIKADSLKILDLYNQKISMLKDSATNHDPEIKSLKNKLVLHDRVSFIEVFAKSDSLINKYYALIEKGNDIKTIAATNTERPGYKERAGVYDSVEVDSNSPLAKEAYALQKPGDFTKPFKNANGYSIVKLIAKEPSRFKTFEEAKAEISGIYQENEAKRLENEYVTSLKGIYKPVIYYNKVEEAFKSN